MAQNLGLVIIPVMTKIDSPLSRVDDIANEIVELLHIEKDTILKVSGKTGDGVPELLEQIIKRIPAPIVETKDANPQALVLILNIQNTKALLCLCEVIAGSFNTKMQLQLIGADETFHQLKGILSPKENKKKKKV